MTGIRGTNLERFERSYIPEPMSGCWLWLGALSEKGYGWFYYPPRNMVRAHIASWELHRGSRGSFNVLHGCDVRCCVNPDHLRLGTQQENVDDREKRRRRAPPLGTKNGRATLTAAQVLAIRADNRPPRFVAATFKTTAKIVGRIKRRETWKHFP